MERLAWLLGLEWWRAGLVVAAGLIMYAATIFVFTIPVDKTTFAYAILVFLWVIMFFILIPGAMAFATLKARHTWRSIGRTALFVDLAFVVGVSLYMLVMLLMEGDSAVSFSQQWWRIPLGLLVVPFISLATPFTWNMLGLSTLYVVAFHAVRLWIAKRRSTQDLAAAA